MKHRAKGIADINRPSRAADVQEQSAKLKSQSKRLREVTEATGIDFIMTELDLAVTFCDIARSSDDPQKRERNTDRAKAAFQTAQSFLAKKKDQLPENSRAQVVEKIAGLRDLLDGVGTSKTPA